VRLVSNLEELLSQRVKSIKPSATLAISAKAKTMRTKGIDVINLSVGEPDFDTPEHIKYAAIKALCDGWTKYTEEAGLLEVRKAICKKLKEENALSYEPENIVISCGAKHALFNAFQALLDAGDQVIIPTPCWVSYPDMVRLCGAEPVLIPTDSKNGFLPEPERIEKAITDRTKVLLINSPCNPTGAVYEGELLKELARIVERHENIIVISDEIYEKFVYDGAVHVSIASLSDKVKERAVVVNGLSKTFAMTGWRLGYAAAPKPIAQAMAKVQGQSASHPTSFVQMAAITALGAPQEFVQKMVKEYDERRKLIVSLLNEIPNVRCDMPKGAFYVFADFSDVLGRSYDGVQINTSVELSEFILERAHVATVPGEPFGAEGFLRLSYATSKERIEEGLRRIKGVLS
jgi:aspartate aminotransferase